MSNPQDPAPAPADSQEPARIAPTKGVKTHGKTEARPVEVPIGPVVTRVPPPETQKTPSGVQRFS